MYHILKEAQQSLNLPAANTLEDYPVVSVWDIMCDG